MSDVLIRLGESVDLAPLAEALRAAGYCEELLSGTTGIGPGQPIDVPLAERATAEPTAANTLIRLFTLGRSEPRAAVEAAVAPMPIDELLQIGLLTAEQDLVRSEFSLQPFEDQWVVHDFPPYLARNDPPASLVQGVTMASVMLANLTVRRPSLRVLDVGCGGGIQLLRASQHAQSMVGTDINERALNLARFNLRLNGAADFDLRAGSLLDPVAGETFDLVVSNPPFAVSPESRFQYRDSALPGDSLCQQLLRDVPHSLNEGGFATVLCDWFHSRDDDWAARPRHWLAESGCDVWLLKFYTQDPLTYAAGWSTPAERRQSDYGQRLDQYVAYYRQLGAARFTRGAVLLRRRQAANWFRTETVEHPENLHGAGPQIERLFAAFDLLHSLDTPEQLLECRLALCPEHQLQHRLVCREGTWQPESSVLELVHGFRFPGNVDPLVGKLLAGCDGRRTVRELVAALAAELKVSPEQITSSAAGVLGTLLEKGFLEIHNGNT